VNAPREIFVLLPGSRWEDVRGTDHRIAMALARRLPVLWVDPPLPVFGGAARRERLPAVSLDEAAPGITRLRALTPPGFTRPGARIAAQAVLDSAIRAALRRLAGRAVAVMVSAAAIRFPAGVAGTRILHVTDDWIAGAGMMGLSRRAARGTLLANAARADTVTAVSPFLAERTAAVCGRSTRVLPNGCTLPAAAGPAAPRRQVAGLVGQLNERLDVDLLESVLASGVPIEVIGPRRERDPHTRDRLDRFLRNGNVTWLGELPEAELAPHLATMGVGLTPYADSDFNRSSFPLKTLDYLAAGAPVVATDLPAVRWLDSGWIEIGCNPQDFVGKVHAVLAAGADPAAETGRREFAGRHSWDARAGQVLDMIGQGAP